MKVGIYTLGCKVNIYESEYVENLLRKNSYEIVSFDEQADIYIINTCSVTNESDKKSRKMIKQARRRNENAVVIVMGCYSQTTKDDIDADIILGNRDKSHILEYIEDYLKEKEKIKRIYDLRNMKDFEKMELDNFENHTRAFVKIQDGCNAFCSYCIIPYARGEMRSKEYFAVIDEVTKLVNNGYKEIVLTGIHTGRYGIDLDNMNLEKLLRRLIEIPNIYRIRLSSIEVNEITDGIMDLISSSKIIARHFHIPLQSGSDTILKKMNRKYDVSYFIDKINKIKLLDPDISITTDLIVGFPGEEETEFQETINTLKEINFTKIHVFPYSRRNGTPASEMSNQVDGCVKRRRVNEVIDLSNSFEYAFYKKFINCIFEGIVENRSDGSVIVLTSNYIPVHINEKCANNTNVSVKILRVDDNGIVYGKVV